jgi:hypothetical protein
LNRGNIHITNSTIANNRSVSQGGGGLNNSGVG